MMTVSYIVISVIVLIILMIWSLDITYWRGYKKGQIDREHNNIMKYHLRENEIGEKRWERKPEEFK